MSKEAAQYDHICESMIVQLYDRVRYLEQKDRYKLNASQCAALRLTWNAFIAGDATERGFQMFCRMFNNHPETKELFKFATGKADDDMRASGKLLFHVTRVVKYISKAVDAASSLEDVVPLLRQVGGRHGTSGYNVNSKFFPFLGEALRQLMKSDLKNYTPEHNKLWEGFWAFLVKCLQDGQEAYGN